MLWPISWMMLPTCLAELHQPKFTLAVPEEPGQPTEAEQEPVLVMPTSMRGACSLETKRMHVFLSHSSMASSNASFLSWSTEAAK